MGVQRLTRRHIKEWTWIAGSVASILFGHASACMGSTPTSPIPTDRKRYERYIEEHARQVVTRSGREFKVTSEYRGDSEAHLHGAVDYSSKDITQEERLKEARELSKELGHDCYVIVERVERRAPGAERPARQTSTTFVNGVEKSTRIGVVLATETHTHVQPSKEEIETMKKMEHINARIQIKKAVTVGKLVPLQTQPDKSSVERGGHGNGELRGARQPFEGKWTGAGHPSERISHTS
jgi:hypothetical protein